MRPPPSVTVPEEEHRVDDVADDVGQIEDEAEPERRHVQAEGVGPADSVSIGFNDTRRRKLCVSRCVRILHGGGRPSRDFTGDRCGHRAAKEAVRGVADAHGAGVKGGAGGIRDQTSPQELKKVAGGRKRCSEGNIKYVITGSVDPCGGETLVGFTRIFPPLAGRGDKAS